MSVSSTTRRLMMSAALVFVLPAAGIAEDYVIGVAAAQSGGMAPFDQPSFAGFEFCVGELNAAGGIAGQYPIKLEIRDTRSEMAETVKFAQEFVDLVAHVDWHADGASLIGDGTSDSLSNPPGGVR